MKISERTEYTIKISYEELMMIYDALMYSKKSDHFTKSLSDLVTDMTDELSKYLYF